LAVPKPQETTAEAALVAIHIIWYRVILRSGRGVERNFRSGLWLDGRLVAARRRRRKFKVFKQIILEALAYINMKTTVLNSL
jgi:hypothetical protein